MFTVFFANDGFQLDHNFMAKIESFPLFIDDCAANPCLNGGQCIDGVAVFTCICTAEYTGTRCETLAGEYNISKGVGSK